jgi:hypothetical protein
MSEETLLKFIDFLCRRHYSVPPTKAQTQKALADFKREQEKDEWPEVPNDNPA